MAQSDKQREVSQLNDARMARVTAKIEEAHDAMHAAVDAAKTKAEEEAAVAAFHAAKKAIRAADPEIPYPAD